GPPQRRSARSSRLWASAPDPCFVAHREVATSRAEHSAGSALARKEAARLLVAAVGRRRRARILLAAIGRDCALGTPRTTGMGTTRTGPAIWLRRAKRRATDRKSTRLNSSH